MNKVNKANINVTLMTSEFLTKAGIIPDQANIMRLKVSGVKKSNAMILIIPFLETYYRPDKEYEIIHNTPTSFLVELYNIKSHYTETQKQDAVLNLLTKLEEEFKPLNIVIE